MLRKLWVHCVSLTTSLQARPLLSGLAALLPMWGLLFPGSHVSFLLIHLLVLEDQFKQLLLLLFGLQLYWGITDIKLWDLHHDGLIYVYILKGSPSSRQLTHPSPHILVFFFFFDVEHLSSTSVANFSYTTWLSMTVPMFHIRSSELIHSYSWKLVPFYPISPPSSSWKSLFGLFLDWHLKKILDSTYKWDHAVSVFLSSSFALYNNKVHLCCCNIYTYICMYIHCKENQYGGSSENYK